MKVCGKTVGTQTNGPDWLERILAGKKEGLDWPVPAQDLLLLLLLLLLLRWYSDTETIPGCDWRRLVGSDKAGVAPGNGEGRRVAQVG